MEGNREKQSVEGCLKVRNATLAYVTTSENSYCSNTFVLGGIDVSIKKEGLRKFKIFSTLEIGNVPAKRYRKN